MTVPESLSGDQQEKAGPLQICQNSQRKAAGSCQATLSPLQQEMETNRTLITLGCISPAGQRFHTRAGQSGSSAPVMISRLLSCDTKTPPAGVLL